MEGLHHLIVVFTSSDQYEGLFDTHSIYTCIQQKRGDDNEFIREPCKVRGVKLFLEYQCTVSVELDFLKLKSFGGGENGNSISGKIDDFHVEIV